MLKELHSNIKNKIVDGSFTDWIFVLTEFEVEEKYLIQYFDTFGYTELFLIIRNQKISNDFYNKCYKKLKDLQ